MFSFAYEEYFPPQRSVLSEEEQITKTLNYNAEIKMKTAKSMKMENKVQQLIANMER